MHVVVGVDMIEGKPGGAEGLELGTDFRRQLTARGGREEEAETGPDQVGVEQPVGPYQSGNFSGRQRRLAAHQHDVQTDREAHQTPGPRHRIHDLGSGHHQARRRENSIFVGGLYRLVDRK